MARTLFIFAGEPSGDMHGAMLVRALREREPDIRLAGVGSHRMREAGVDVYHDLTSLAAIGILEVAKVMFKVRKVWVQMVARLDSKDFSGDILRSWRTYVEHIPPSHLLHDEMPEIIFANFGLPGACPSTSNHELNAKWEDVRRAAVEGLDMPRMELPDGSTFTYRIIKTIPSGFFDELMSALISYVVVCSNPATPSGPVPAQDDEEGEHDAAVVATAMSPPISDQEDDVGDETPTTTTTNAAATTTVKKKVRHRTKPRVTQIAPPSAF